KGVGFNDVGTRLKVCGVDFMDNIGPGEAEQVVVALQVAGVIREAFAAEVPLFKFVTLYHGAHGAIEHQYPLLQFADYRFCHRSCILTGFSSMAAQSAVYTWQNTIRKAGKRYAGV